MLKHVFYLHSQTCYITALKVIKNKKISNDQVILLISRNTPLFSNKYQSFHIYPLLDNWPFYTQKKIFNLKWIFNYKALNIFDNVINNFIKFNFVFYSQNSRHFKYNVFISSKNCIETPLQTKIAFRNQSCLGSVLEVVLARFWGLLDN